MRAWLRRQYGLGPVFAVEAVLQVFAVRREAIAAVERQRAEANTLP